MRSILNSVIYALRYVGVVRQLPGYFDEEERRLVFQSVVIGVVVWAVIFALKAAVHRLFENTLHWVESGPSQFLIFIPLLLGALLVAVLSRFRASTIYYRDKTGHIHELNDVEGDGLERAISLYYTSEPTFEQALTGQEGPEVRWQLPTFTLAIRKFLATLITLGSGGSGGLEASVTLIGESISAGLFKPRQAIAEVDRHTGLAGRLWRWWRPDNSDDLQTAQLSGIAAAVAVLLGAPFAAAFFAIEVVYRQRPILEKLVYSLISALTAFFLTDLFAAGHTAAFEIETRFLPPSDVRYFAVLALLATVISLVSLYFAHVRTVFENAFHHYLPVTWKRHLAGAAITGSVALLAAYIIHTFGWGQHGLELVLGPGELAIDMAFAGELTVAVALLALVTKMVATLATIGSGGSAGLLIPSLYLGAMVAAALARVFDYEPMMLVIPAMTASLVSIVNVPLAAILFTVEVFGASYMVPALLMLVVTSILAHDNTIYRTQRQKYDSRQILPGVSVRRVPVPIAWGGHTLIELDFRKEFDLNVIGLLEQASGAGRPTLRLAPPADTRLEVGDTLVVLGSDERLDILETAIRELNKVEQSGSTDTVSAKKRPMQIE